MKKLWNKVDLQTMLGGVFGIIAMTAIIYQMSLADFDSASVAGGIKDAASILVTIIVLIIAVRKLIPKKQKLSFEERLKNALENWRAANSRLIVKDDDKKGTYGFSMRTNVKDFYHAVPLTKNVGWFVRMPAINAATYEKENLEIDFHLNKGTFFEGITLTAEELQRRYGELKKLFREFIEEKYGDFLTIKITDDNIKVVIKSGIKSDEDINRFIDVLNSMVQAYLVAASIKV